MSKPFATPHNKEVGRHGIYRGRIYPSNAWSRSQARAERALLAPPPLSADERRKARNKRKAARRKQ